MSSWRVKLKSSGSNEEVIVDLIDTPGPYNKFKFSDPSAFLPSEGDFTNQTGRVVPTVSGWVLNEFDIDEVEEGWSKREKGEVTDSGGTFPPGYVDWTVVKKI